MHAASIQVRNSKTRAMVVGWYVRRSCERFQTRLWQPPPGETVLALEQTIKLNEIFGVRGILPMFALFSYSISIQIKRITGRPPRCAPFENNLTWSSITVTPFALGQLHFSQQFSFRDCRTWALVMKNQLCMQPQFDVSTVRALTQY